MKTHASALMLLLALPACAPIATYPPEKGIINPSAATNEPIPTLMAEGIRYAYARWGDEDDFGINLPPGTPPQIYEKVIRRVGAGHPMEDPDEPAYHVTQVLARGLEGNVDLFYPTADGSYRLVTLTFRRHGLQGYRHERTKVWRTGEEPPPPHYTREEATASAGW